MPSITIEDVEFTIKVVSLERETTTGIVKSVQWQHAATYETHRSDRFEVTTLGAAEEGAETIPYENLSNQTVIDWINEIVGTVRMGLMKETLFNIIKTRIEPQVLNEPPPWLIETPAPAPEPSEPEPEPAPEPTPEP